MNDGTNLKAKVKKGCNICHKTNKFNLKEKAAKLQNCPEVHRDDSAL